MQHVLHLSIESLVPEICIKQPGSTTYALLMHLSPVPLWGVCVCTGIEFPKLQPAAFQGVRGLAAKNDITADEIIVSVPRSAALSLPPKQRCPCPVRGSSSSNELDTEFACICGPGCVCVAFLHMHKLPLDCIAPNVSSSCCCCCTVCGTTPPTPHVTHTHMYRSL